MINKYHTNTNDQVESWIIESQNQEIDVCNLAKQFGLKIGIKKETPLGLYSEKDKTIYLQNPELSIFSFWIFLHELGHHKNTLQKDSRDIQALYSLKDKSSLSQKLDFLKEITKVCNISIQEIFQEETQEWNSLCSQYYHVSSQLESISSRFYSPFGMPHAQFFAIANPLRLELDTLSEKIKNLYYQFNIDSYLKLPVALSELLAWSHALNSMQEISDYFPAQILNTEFQYYRLDGSFSNMNLIEFMCKSLKSHKVETIFTLHNGSSAIENISLSQELENLLSESQSSFQDFIALTQ